MSKIGRSPSSGAPAKKTPSRRTRASAQSLSFGLYLLDQKRALDEPLAIFCRWLGERLDAKVVAEELQDYETLARRVKDGALDIAWLPPIVFLRVGQSSVVPVASLRRSGGSGGYETALVVREDSRLRTVEDLRGASVAWVDAWSAGGYVIPRVRLRLGGVDPSRLFGTECFYGSHTAAVRAVLDREVDVAATYAKTDGQGNVVGGAWTEIGGARVRALMTFGEIPPDVIAVAPSVPANIGKRLVAALEATATNRPIQKLVKTIFGADAFGPVDPSSYEGLQAALSIDDPPSAARLPVQTASRGFSRRT